MPFYLVNKQIEIWLLGIRNIRVFGTTKVEEMSLNGYFDTRQLIIQLVIYYLRPFKVKKL